MSPDQRLYKGHAPPKSEYGTHTVIWRVKRAAHGIIVGVNMSSASSQWTTHWQGACVTLKRVGKVILKVCLLGHVFRQWHSVSLADHTDPSWISFSGLHNSIDNVVNSYKQLERVQGDITHPQSGRCYRLRSKCYKGALKTTMVVQRYCNLTVGNNNHWANIMVWDASYTSRTSCSCDVISWLVALTWGS